MSLGVFNNISLNESCTFYRIIFIVYKDNSSSNSRFFFINNNVLELVKGFLIKSMNIKSQVNNSIKLEVLVFYDKCPAIFKGIHVFRTVNFTSFLDALNDYESYAYIVYSGFLLSFLTVSMILLLTSIGAVHLGKRFINNKSSSSLTIKLFVNKQLARSAPVFLSILKIFCSTNLKMNFLSIVLVILEYFLGTVFLLFLIISVFTIYRVFEFQVALGKALVLVLLTVFFFGVAGLSSYSEIFSYYTAYLFQIFFKQADSILYKYFSFNFSISQDTLNIVVKTTLYVFSILYIYLIADFLKDQKITSFEYYIIILFALLGLVVLCSSNDLLQAYVSLETTLECLNSFSSNKFAHYNLFCLLENNFWKSDSPLFYKISLQEPGSSYMGGLQIFNNQQLLLIIPAIVILLVGVLLYATLEATLERLNSFSSNKFAHSNLLEIFRTSPIILIFLGIALSFFSILFCMDESPHPRLTLTMLGDEWYWSHEDFSDLNSNINSHKSLKFTSYMLMLDNLNLDKENIESLFSNLNTERRIILPTNTEVRLVVNTVDSLYTNLCKPFKLKFEAFSEKSDLFKAFFRQSEISDTYYPSHGFSDNAYPYNKSTFLENFHIIPGCENYNVGMPSLKAHKFCAINHFLVEVQATLENENKIGINKNYIDNFLIEVQATIDKVNKVDRNKIVITKIDSNKNYNILEFLLNVDWRLPYFAPTKEYQHESLRILHLFFEKLNKKLSCLNFKLANIEEQLSSEEDLIKKILEVRKQKNRVTSIPTIEYLQKWLTALWDVLVNLPSNMLEKRLIIVNEQLEFLKLENLKPKSRIKGSDLTKQEVAEIDKFISGYQRAYELYEHSKAFEKFMSTSFDKKYPSQDQVVKEVIKEKTTEEILEELKVFENEQKVQKEYIKKLRAAQKDALRKPGFFTDTFFMEMYEHWDYDPLGDDEIPQPKPKKGEKK